MSAGPKMLKGLSGDVHKAFSAGFVKARVHTKDLKPMLYCEYRPPLTFTLPPEDARRAARLPAEALSTLAAFWRANEPPLFSPIELVQDARRQFGDAAWSPWCAAVRAHDPDVTEAELATVWHGTDPTAEPTQFDRLLIDACEDARASGAVFDDAAEATIAGLYDAAFAEGEAEKERRADALADALIELNRRCGDVVAEMRAAETRESFMPGDWFCDIRGVPERDNPDNVRYLLALLDCAVRWNSWLERAEIHGSGKLDPEFRWSEWTYLDDAIVGKIRMRAMRTKTRFCPSREFLWEALLTIAHENKIDPAIDLLADLESAWDGTPRLASWLSETCGVPNDAYHAAVSRNVIGGMVRRVRQPGCKHDEMAVLIGRQGTLKSTMIAALAPVPEWYSANVHLGDEAKELVLSLAGKCVVEVEEMVSKARSVNHIKAMLSRSTDAGRTAYARAVTERPRRNIFVSSTNDDSPLTDDTGNRRFLPVRVSGEIKITWLRENISKLLGEAAALESSGDLFTIPREVWGEAAQAQDAARARPEYEIIFAEWFTPPEGAAVYVTVPDLSEMARSAAGRPINASQYSKTMRALGYINGKKRVDGKPASVWHRGDLQHATRIVPQMVGGRTVARMFGYAESPVTVRPPLLPVLR